MILLLLEYLVVNIFSFIIFSVLILKYFCIFLLLLIFYISSLFYGYPDPFSSEFNNISYISDTYCVGGIHEVVTTFLILNGIPHTLSHF